MANTSKQVKLKTGGQWRVRGYDEKIQGQWKGKDYLLVQLDGGSFASNKKKPLWMTNITICPFPIGATPPEPILFEMARGGAKSALFNVFNWCAGQKTNSLIDHRESSPDSQNATTAHTSNWGLNVGGSLTPGANAGLSYNHSKSVTIRDLELVKQIYQANKNKGGTGVQWHMTFTKKDGMNTSSFEPRFDAMFMLKRNWEGTVPLYFREQLIYWGKFADKGWDLAKSVGAGAASGAVVGSAALPVVLTGPGALIGAIVGAFASIPGEIHNNELYKAMKGDELALANLIIEAKKAGKIETSHKVIQVKFEKIKKRKMNN